MKSIKCNYNVILMFINALFIFTIVLLFNNVIDIIPLWYVICIIWVINIIIKYKFALKERKKTRVEIILLAIIILLNIFLLYNIPPFTYKAATQLVQENYAGLSNDQVNILDNKNIKHHVAFSGSNGIMKYKMYIIVVYYNGEQKYIWFDPYNGKYDEFNLEE